MKKIPVGQTIAEAYRFTFAGVERVIGVSWLPVIIMTVGGYFVAGPYLAAEASMLESGDASQFGPAWLSFLAFQLVSVVLTSVIGVAITREILKPLERPLFLRFGLGATEMRLAGSFIGLFILMFLFVFACILIGLVAGGLLNSLIPATPGVSNAQRALGFGLLVALCLSPVLIFLLLRLSFFMAPSVVMEGHFGLERSWQLTKGNVWRILAITLAIALPIVIVSGGIQLAVLGPEYVRASAGMFGDKAAQAQSQAEQLRIMTSNLPFLMGLSFLLAPFTYGLTFAAPAVAYRALTAEERQ